MKHSKYLRKTGRMFHPAELTVVAIPSKLTVGHTTLKTVNYVLRVSAYQNGHQAPLLQTFNNISPYTTCNLFINEDLLVYNYLIKY